MEGSFTSRGSGRRFWDRQRSHSHFESISEGRPMTGRGLTTASSSRPTFQWPFHNISISNSTSNPSSIPLSSSFGRRGTGPWGFTRPASSVLDSEIIPDYVVNFIRGETPETLARKNRRRGPQTPEVQRQSRNFESHVVDLYGSGASVVNSRAPSALNDLEKMLGEDQRPSLKRRLMAGWRGGVALNVLLAFLILVVAIVCLVLSSLKAGMLGKELAIMQGESKKVQNLGRGLHVVLNIFAVVLVAGANYVFQILCSPTRAEVDTAHEKVKWLDIGIPSLRNLSAISFGRALLSATILILAVSSQVIYNAVIFTAQTAVFPSLVLVAPSFLDGASFANSSDHNAGGLSRAALLDLQTLAGGDTLARLTVGECIAKFDSVFQTDYSAVLVVANTANGGSNSLLQSALPGTSLSTLLDSLNWAPSPPSSLVDFCLAQRGPESSASLTLSGSLLGVVAILNLLFVLAFVLALARPSFDPLVTLGDALASFLATPDPTTQNACLMTKADVQRKRHRRWRDGWAGW
ncbi:hypothetical protein G7046_g7342 [Stylonectria norvegica]|nr:hypothetical protein G7046_g7342 [Stylonectria norvegica]